MSLWSFVQHEHSVMPLPSSQDHTHHILGPLTHVSSLEPHDSSHSLFEIKQCKEKWELNRLPSQVCSPPTGRSPARYPRDVTDGQEAKYPSPSAPPAPPLALNNFHLSRPHFLQQHHFFSNLFIPPPRQRTQQRTRCPPPKHSRPRLRTPRSSPPSPPTTSSSSSTVRLPAAPSWIPANARSSVQGRLRRGHRQGPQPWHVRHQGSPSHPGGLALDPILARWSAARTAGSKKLTWRTGQVQEERLAKGRRRGHHARAGPGEVHRSRGEAQEHVRIRCEQGARDRRRLSALP